MVVTIFLFYGERLAIPSLGRLKIPQLLGQPSQLVIGFGGSQLVAWLPDSEGLAIQALSCSKIALLLGNDSELVIGSGCIFRATGGFPLLGRPLEKPLCHFKVPAVLGKRSQTLGERR